MKEQTRAPRWVLQQTNSLHSRTWDENRSMAVDTRFGIRGDLVPTVIGPYAAWGCIYYGDLGHKANQWNNVTEEKGRITTTKIKNRLGL